MQSFVLGLTLFRILMSPFIFLSAVFFESYWLAFIVFNFAAFTDYLDGALARKYAVESKMGAILDPIADKVLVVFTIISVLSFTGDAFIALMAAFILAREFWVSALREYAGLKNKSSATKVSFLAKSKTTFQFIALDMYFLGQAANLAFITFLANFVLFISVVLAIKSAIIYSQKVLEA